MNSNMRAREVDSSTSIFKRRSVAFFIDVLILFPIGFVISIILGFWWGYPSPGFEMSIRIVISFSILVWLYFIVSDISKNGATIGKRIMKIRIETIDGRKLTVKTALIRTAIKLLPWELTHLTFFGLSQGWEIFSSTQMILTIILYPMMFIYLYLMFRSKGQQGIQDMVVKTTAKALDSIN